jgi:hypothetical protein
VKPTYQALEEIASGKLGFEVEAAGEMGRELAEAGGKPTWFRSLSAEEVIPEEVVVEGEEHVEEEEAPVEAPVAGAPAEDLVINEFEEESLDELGEMDVMEREEAEE